MITGLILPRAPAPSPAATMIDNIATRRGQAPWATNEPAIESSRRSTRKNLLKALDQPWTAFCQEEGRRKLKSSLDDYLGMRGTQSIGYRTSWGEAGGRYIAQVWRSPDDPRVERLLAETYSRGYIQPEQLKDHNRPRLAEIVDGARVTGQGC